MKTIIYWSLLLVLLPGLLGLEPVAKASPAVQSEIDKSKAKETVEYRDDPKDSFIWWLLKKCRKSASEKCIKRVVREFDKKRSEVNLWIEDIEIGKDAAKVVIVESTHSNEIYRHKVEIPIEKSGRFSDNPSIKKTLVCNVDEMLALIKPCSPYRSTMRLLGKRRGHKISKSRDLNKTIESLLTGKLNRFPGCEKQPITQFRTYSVNCQEDMVPYMNPCKHFIRINLFFSSMDHLIGYSAREFDLSVSAGDTKSIKMVATFDKEDLPIFSTILDHYQKNYSSNSKQFNVRETTTLFGSN